MWGKLSLSELSVEWEIVKPLLAKNLLLKVGLFVLVTLLYNSENLIYKTNLIMNHVYNPSNSTFGRGLVAFAEWDGLYFLHASLQDYNNLKMFAFYPGLPAAIKSLLQVVMTIPGVSEAAASVSFSLLVLAVGVGINLFCHLASNWLLYQWLRLRGFSQSQARFAALTFGLGGNSLFHVTLYSESTYMFATLLPLYILTRAGNNPASMRLPQFMLFTFGFGMSGFFRSVGMMNAAYLGYPLVLELVYVTVKEKHTMKALGLLFRIFFVVASFLTPPLFLHFKTRRLFCHAATAEDPKYVAPGFCDSATGFFYSYIQDVCWRLRLFDYLKNPYHMDMWAFAFVSCMVLTIWLYRAYRNAGIYGLLTLHIPEYLSNRNLQSQRILELPELVMFSIQYAGYYGYAHLGSIDRFWSATPSYYLFSVVAQQALVRLGESRDKTTAVAAWKKAARYIIPANLVVRQFVVPIFYALRIIPV